MALLQLAVIAYALGGVWGVLMFARIAREEGLRSYLAWAELASLSFFLWPLILLQMLVFSLRIYRSYQRERIARARGRV